MKISQTELLLEAMVLRNALGELIAQCSNPRLPGEHIHPGVRMPDKEVLERVRVIHLRYERLHGPKKKKRAQTIGPVEFENADLGEEG